LIVPDLSDPFFATCVNTIYETAWNAGYLTLMAASFHSEDVERQVTEVMIRRRVAGMLVIPSGTQNAHFVSQASSSLLCIPILPLPQFSRLAMC
jgi:DNA-binding LacI/PurR family transcriptional regulator